MRTLKLKKFLKIAQSSVTKEDIIRLADELGIEWDYDPAFMVISEELTGKSLLSEMTPVDLANMYKLLQEDKNIFTKR